MLFSKYPDDIKRFQEMVNDRRKIIDNTPATPLPKTYAVNELSKALHPNVIPAEIIATKEVGRNCKVITLKSTSENGRFPYFRAGQFITLSAKVGESFVTRPYSISSSPYQAMEGIQSVNANAEVIGARKGEPNLKTKIDKIDDAIEANANEKDNNSFNFANFLKTAIGGDF